MEQDSHTLFGQKGVRKFSVYKKNARARTQEELEVSDQEKSDERRHYLAKFAYSLSEEVVEEVTCEKSRIQMNKEYFSQ